MILRGVRLGAICLTLLALVGGCQGRESSFCSDFQRVDKALGALRDAKATGDFDRVPDLVDDVAEAYTAIEPPPMLRADWATAIEFFRHQAENARSLLRDGEFTKTPAEQAARYDNAFTSITDYGVAQCGRVRGKLVP